MTPWDNLTDLQLLTLCCYGEARGEGLDGICAVAHVAMNRARKPSWWGTTLREVILKPKQFSCFNEGDVNREVLAGLAAKYDLYRNTNSMLKATEWVCRGVIDGQLWSNVGSATHYHSVAVKPAWAAKMDKLITVGRHVFYLEDAPEKPADEPAKGGSDDTVQVQGRRQEGRQEMNWKEWLYGLGASVIGGVANAVTLAIVDPSIFNWETGKAKLLTVCAVSGIWCMAAYLKSSPLPPKTEVK